MTHHWLRVDGSARLGLGHVMRMIALAEAVTDAGDTVRFIVDGDPAAQDLPTRHGHVVESPRHGSWLSQVASDEVIVFDGYHFDTQHHSAAKRTGAVVAAFDDLGSGPFDVDVLVNQSMRHGVDYDVPTKALMLLGPRYACIRKAFRDRSNTVRGLDPLLVSTGGSDPLQLGPLLAEALAVRPEPFSQVWVLVGPSGTPFSASAPSRIRILRNPADLPRVFDRVGAAISAAGTMTWELLAAGVPTAIFPTVANQQGVAGTVQQADAALVLGGPEDLLQRLDEVLAALASPRIRANLTESARELVDGWGAERVRRALVHDSLDLA